MLVKETAEEIIAIGSDDPLRKEKIMDIVKRAVHEEKFGLFIRLKHYTSHGESKSLQDFVRDKLLTHDRLSHEWGVIYGYALGTELTFKPHFPNLKEKALYFARRWHENQTYGGDNGYPYHHHLIKVAMKIGEFFGDNETLIAAAYLHDCMEDCGKTKAELEELFGPEIADIVYRVTNEPGRNRADRHAATYHKIKGHKGATAVKLADRISNMEASWSDAYYAKKDKFINMYLKEMDSFREALYVPGLGDEIEKMWQKVDALKQNPHKIGEDLDD